MTKNKSKKVKNLNTNPSASSNGWIIFSIILTVFVFYGRTIDYDFTLDDDLFYVKNQTVLQGVKGIPQIFKENSLQGIFGSNNIDDVYRPVTLTSFAIQKQMVGISSKASHFFNILVYALCGILIYSVLKRLFKDWPIWVSGAITLLFIAHPVHTEVVCSIKSRDELMSCMFGFLFLRSLLINREKKSVISYLVPCIWIMLALLTKESSISFIGLAPFVYFFAGENSIKKIALRMMPFFVCAGIFFLIRFMVLTGETSASRGLVIYNSLNGANSFSDLYGTRFVILLLFIKQLIFPAFLSWDYSYNQVPLVSIISITPILSLLLHLALVALMIKLFLDKSPLAFGLLFYFITSVITNNFFIKIGATFAERFLFIPTLGYLIFLAAGISYLLKIPMKALVVNQKARIVFSVIFIFYSVVTFARIPVWKNNTVLYESGVESAPNSARANCAMASDYRLRGESTTIQQEKNDNYAKAQQYYLKSIQILPSYTDAYYNLGVMAFSQADTLTAIEWYKKALNTNPKYKNAMHNLSVLFLNQNKTDSALIYLERIRSYYPDDVTEFPNLAFLYLKRKEPITAKKYAQLGIDKDPKNPANYRNMAASSYDSGDTANARIYYQQYLDLGGK